MSENQVKICQFCGGEINEDAKKCKFCGEWVISEENELPQDILTGVHFCSIGFGELCTKNILLCCILSLA